MRTFVAAVGIILSAQSFALPFLKVEKTKIVTENRDEFQLRGMSLFWSQWSQEYWTPDTVRKLKTEWNVNAIRLPMGIEMGGYLENRTEEDKVHQLVAAAIENDLYVIIDWHDHNAHLHKAEAVGFFSRMAERYKDEPNVIFEIFNEPIGISWPEVKSYAIEVISAIRPYSNAVVIVGTPNWSQDVDLAALDPIRCENIVYALHFYSATHRQDLRARAETARASGLPILISEFGISEAWGGGIVDTVEAERWLDWADQNSIGWFMWALNDKDESSNVLWPSSTANDWHVNSTGEWIKTKF